MSWIVQEGYVGDSCCAAPGAVAAVAPPEMLRSSSDLSDVPVVGAYSTTGGLSVGDALTYSSGNFLLDAAIGAGVGYLVAPSHRILFTIMGGLAAGGLGVLGLLGIVGAGLVARR